MKSRAMLGQALAVVAFANLVSGSLFDRAEKLHEEGYQNGTATTRKSTLSSRYR
ncbi:hypothetical protein M407DRAFT_243416 [Tulasnella calospora MUT 4182]|uniref:Uncharacterized protein n=1 Tax=Tulasnella calospora MUT 4182 TaxID=1051891 RepID=A0A0C3QJF1_9AGAM|nr:hypothetical protein M407DRAFT_243416 [Tulasnella calospora MUT 4182]